MFFKSNEEIRKELDETLDRLLKNSMVIDEIKGQEEFQDELKKLTKLQESLMAHLMHMDDLLQRDTCKSTNEPITTKQIAKRLKRSSYIIPKDTIRTITRRRSRITAKK
tara:strand:- start:231 stop:557 length:327 start_codon:yes stop_codon:yes gene_type:complete